MSRETILNKLKDILLSMEDINSDIINQADENTELFSGLGLSSFKLLYIAIIIEEEFGIRFNSLGLSAFTTIKDIIDYISSQVK